MVETLAFFGGTFDPVHGGHVAIARSVVEQAGLDRLTFVPAGVPPHKAGMVSAAEHRLAMLKLAVAGHRELSVSDIELARPGRSFTYDTLCALREIHPRATLQWVIGLDMLEDLPHWYRAADLVREFDFLVAMRPRGMGVPPMRLEGFQPSRTVDNGQNSLSGTSATGEDARGTHGRDAHATLYAVALERATAAVRAAFGDEVANRLTSRILPTPLIDISSTTIRARVAAGQSIDEWVPPGVAGYVKKNGLYRTNRDVEEDDPAKDEKGL